jgi:molecular chaperone DnaK
MTAAIQALKDVIESDNAEEIKSKTEALAQVAMKLGEGMYKAQQDAGAGPEGPQGGPGTGGDHSAGHDDNVVDADFEEVDEKKRGQG